MTKRIDIYRENGQFKISIKDDHEIIQGKNNKITIVLKNWYMDVDFNAESVVLRCTSKAIIKAKDRFSFNLREGTLFLYNSTTYWYWYFRNKELQSNMDTLQASKIITINGDITCPIVGKMIDGIPKPIISDMFNTLKVYGLDFEYDINWDAIITSNGIVIGNITFHPTKETKIFIIDDNGHRTVYTKKKYKLNSLFKETDIDTINNGFVYPNMKGSGINE